MSDASTSNEDMPATHPASVGLLRRLSVALGLLAGLRRHDLRAARTFANTQFAGSSFVGRWWRFTGWCLHQMLVGVPEALGHASFASPVSRVPFWLVDENPLANHPWRHDPGATLPDQADVVVIGAGFAGAATAYHWARKSPEDRQMVVLEMDDPASGASGRNEGLVVMGRYYAMVRETVLAHLDRARTDLTARQRDQLARQFAARYCKAAYRNGDMIEQTIRDEGYDCDYAREGWVQTRGADDQAKLAESVQLAVDSGCTDWIQITPQEVMDKTGMQVRHNAGFSIAAGSFHPAKWVWCLLRSALSAGRVQLFCRTKVSRVDGSSDDYVVHTSRGTIRARHIVNATESYSALLHPQLHDALFPVQTQAAAGEGGPRAMKPHVGISGLQGFFGKHGSHVLIGSDATRVPDAQAGQNRPSRFITKFLIGEMKRHYAYEPYRYHVTHEWSGTPGFTPDEYPVVGLLDGKRQYIIGGQCGSGTGVSFNAARCICNRILGLTDEPDDYPAAYFAPSRLLDPANHPWPAIEE